MAPDLADVLANPSTRALRPDDCIGPELERDMAISKVSFFKTPQAADDFYYWTEETLKQDSNVYQSNGHLMLDVMANDLGGNAKTLYSIDDGCGNAINPTDLFNVDTLINGISAWEPTA